MPRPSQGGDRLPRLARTARAPLPRAQALGGDPVVRRRRASASTSARDVALAQEFASWVAADDRFELVAPHPLSLVTFRLRDGDDATRQLMERVNASGRMYLTHTVVNGAVTLRLAIGSPQTERRHVDAAWAELQQAADA